jgi:sec-independent protein translocase protein TatC
MTPTESFISHLIELRNRLLRIVLGFVLVFFALFPFANKIYALLAAPMLAKLPAGGQMIATAVTTPFFVPMKVAMMAAFVISLPHTLYQIWAFVAPGLYAHEKKLMVPVITASSILFLAGMAFAYFAVFPVVFGFIVGSAPVGVAVMTDISQYLDFVMTLFLAFGLAFEVPIAVVLIARFGWVTIVQLKEARSYVIVGAFVIGAIFTPPDIISQFMLAVPLWLLYEAGIVIAQLTNPKGNPKTPTKENTIKPS